MTTSTRLQHVAWRTALHDELRATLLKEGDMYALLSYDEVGNAPRITGGINVRTVVHDPYRYRVDDSRFRIVAYVGEVCQRTVNSYTFISLGETQVLFGSRLGLGGILVTKPAAICVRVADLAEFRDRYGLQLQHALRS